MPRFTIVVLDSVGVGAMPDAERFGDAGANTLAHVMQAAGGLNIPNLTDLGLCNIDGLNLPGVAHPSGCYGRCAERSDAKDTTSGHFEIAGLVVGKPYRVFEKFPPRIIGELERRIGTKTIGNYPASGTEIIQALGDEHMSTGYPIVYTSADSIMQIAMHEDVIPLARQYEICGIARKLMQGDDTVGRIICRPFAGGGGRYARTENRRDFAVDPPGCTLLDLLKDEGRDVIAIGKIEDIFNRRGITEIEHTKNNAQGIDAVARFLGGDFDGLLFANLVDFDMLYGHRNDAEGYARALEYFDGRLPLLMERMAGNDILAITADHGCDPTHPGTDHTREYIPLLVWGPKLRSGANLGTRRTFADIGATVADYFGCEGRHKLAGESFLGEIKGM
ncbi:MAG: phosphopentomutase [Synergistaceae bacterium]|jgi:phosphopentomutase|nr:phosphopentomutase [Synergistaceae bacterium]